MFVRRMIKRLLAAEDKVKAFSQLIEKQLYEHPDAYIARQQFFRNDQRRGDWELMLLQRASLLFCHMNIRLL